MLILFLPVIVGGLLGTPAGLSFVETESMEPILDPGDGFILIPTQIVGEYKVGDVITFDAENFPYDYVTHRIIGVTSEGFMTQGDNNTFADQSGTFNEPYVKREQIAGKVLAVGGNVVVIPKLGKAITFVGDAVETISRRFYSLVGIDMGNEMLGQAIVTIGILSILAIIIDAVSGAIGINKGKKRERSRKKSSTSPYSIYVIFILFIIFSSSISILSMSQHNRIDLVATEGVTNFRAVHIGETAERYLEVGNSGFIPAHVFIDGQSGIASVEAQTFTLERGETTRVSYLVSAPDEIGYYQDYITIDVYLAIFPHSVAESLRDINRYMPIVAFNIVVIVLSIPIFLYLKASLSTKERIRKNKRAKSVL